MEKPFNIKLKNKSRCRFGSAAWSQVSKTSSPKLFQEWNLEVQFPRACTLTFSGWWDMPVGRAEGGRGYFSFSFNFSIFSKFSVMITQAEVLKMKVKMYHCYNGGKSTLLFKPVVQRIWKQQTFLKKKIAVKELWKLNCFCQSSKQNLLFASITSRSGNLVLFNKHISF